MRRWLPLAALGQALCACGTGPVTESVLVTSNPPGATCSVDQGGTRLGVVAVTPGTMAFQPDGGALAVTCTKSGYVTAHTERVPGYSPVGVTPPGLAYLAVKAFAPPDPKSDWHYPAEIWVDLHKLGTPATLAPLSGLRLQ